jgi:uncharacterized protein
MSGARGFLFGYDANLPLEPIFVDAADSGAVVRLSYLSSGPVRVPALLSMPHERRPAPAILLQHGGGESKDDPLVRLLMRRWSRAGFVCLAIDAPGHGQRSVSESPVSRRGFFEYLRARVQNVIDLRRGIDLLASTDGVRPEAIGYWGVSMGGSVGVMLMATEPRVRAACLCLAGTRSRRSWPDVDAEVAAFAVANLDPLTLAPEVRHPRVLMLNGRDDATIPKEDALRLYEALAGPKEQRWFATGHKLTPAMLRASGEFFATTLSER